MAILNLNNKALKIIPLGGVGEVTKNMYIYQYGDDAIAVDCGIGFPDESTPGVDFAIPDISYLEKTKLKLHAIIITHGHMDHYGSLPYILPRLKNVPVYGSTLTAALAEERVREFGITNPIRAEEKRLKFGPFNIELIHMTHSTPNCKHLLIKTPAGTVYHGADFKFDLNPVDGKPADFAALTRAGTDGIDLLLSDCLGIERPGLTPSERTLKNSIEDEVRRTKGKFVFTTMSSSISRMEMAVRAAAKYGRQTALVGYSINKNIEAAAKHGFFNVPKNSIIKPNKIASMPAHKVAVLVAGAQGQEGSALYRAVAGTHRQLKLKKSDRVVISSSMIPGNESSVLNLIDTLYKKGIDVAYPGVGNQLHITGHGHSGDLALMLRLTRPKHVSPIGGDIRHMHLYKEMAESMGYDQSKVHILEDGEVLSINKGQVKSTGKIESRNIYVDGLGIGDVGKTVLEERQTMSQHGILMVLVPLDNNNQLKGQIQVVTKGFVYVQQSKGLLDQIEKTAKQVITERVNTKMDKATVRHHVEKAVEKIVTQKTERNPLILPVVIES